MEEAIRIINYDPDLLLKNLSQEQQNGQDTAVITETFKKEHKQSYIRFFALGIVFLLIFAQWIIMFSKYDFGKHKSLILLCLTFISICLMLFCTLSVSKSKSRIKDLLFPDFLPYKRVSMLFAWVINKKKILSCSGTRTAGTKFSVTVRTETFEQVDMEVTFEFPFDLRSLIHKGTGELTLDVGNEIVFYASEDAASPNDLLNRF